MSVAQSRPDVGELHIAKAFPGSAYGYGVRARIAAYPNGIARPRPDPS
jgi:hypothetical protein